MSSLSPSPDLRWNKLQDAIPPEISELKSLTHLVVLVAPLAVDVKGAKMLLIERMEKNNTPAAQVKCIAGLLLYHFGVNLPVLLFHILSSDTWACGVVFPYLPGTFMFSRAL